MRNRFKATCWKCRKPVKPDDGYVELHKGQWCVQHVGCKDKEATLQPIFAEA